MIDKSDLKAKISLILNRLTIDSSFNIFMFRQPELWLCDCYLT